MRDGDLRKIFRERLPQFDWTSIETGSTGRGIPDSNFCYQGIEGWIEYKATETTAVDLRPEQVGWLLRRTRAGGRTFVAIRRRHQGGPRKGTPVDELWLYQGALAATLRTDGLKAAGTGLLYRRIGGPGAWEWPLVALSLCKPL